MNYMKQVAQMLGVELGEEFKIKGSDEIYRLSEDRCMEWKLCNREWVKVGSLVDLIAGVDEIYKPILDDKEKKYLSHIIKPFKEKVKYIKKFKRGEDKECIGIAYPENNGKYYTIDFPDFEKGTMYKGMELEKEYTLEDLGL